jgi:RNA polymerase sigma-70 factor (ECF subfamily)
MSLNFFLISTMDEDTCASNYRGDSPVFEDRFLRCRPLLRFLAGRVLGTDEGAEDAVENCWTRASRNPPDFEYEGAFRSWLVRVLIDEALVVLRQRKARLPLSVAVARVNGD